VLKIVEMAVDELRLNERNPRRMRPERWQAFLRSLALERRLLEVRPVIARRADLVLVAGNQRLLGGRELGWRTIPTALVELDELEEAYWMFLDNRGFGEDDEDLAAELLAELKERGGDLDLTGFARAETDALLRRLAHREKDPDALPAAETIAATSEPGAVYELGAHRLMCGDATDPEQVRELLAGAEPTLLATDPPYGVKLDNSWRNAAGINRSRRRRVEHRTTRLASDTRADWGDAYLHAPAVTAAYVWHASRHACLVQAGLEHAGFEVRQQLIWDKGRFVLSRQNYHWQHEPCLYATRPGTAVPWLGPRNQSTVWSAASPKMRASAARDEGDEGVDHPAQKPVLLYRRPIENHLPPGGGVYDPFAGSGTALIAAELTGRVCYAMELDPRCCDLIRARYEEFTGGR
jgi:DNA modification methylase